MIDENQYISTSVKQKQQTLTAFIQRLHEEHDRILDALERTRRDVAFYQPYFEKYRQVEAALKKGYAETPRFKPDFSQKYLETIRSLVVQSVYSRWNQSKQPSTLLQIYKDVSKRIRELIKTGRWPRSWKVPGKRTVDRRVRRLAPSAKTSPRISVFTPRIHRRRLLPSKLGSTCLILSILTSLHVRS